MAHLLLTIMDHIYIVKGKILGERLNGGGEELLVVSTSPTRYFRITTPCASLHPPPHNLPFPKAARFLYRRGSPTRERAVRADEMAEDGKRWRARLSASKICVFIRASALGGWQTRVGFRNRREIGRMGGR